MENFEELVRKMHTQDTKRVEDKSFIEEIRVKLSNQENINIANQKNKAFFDKINELGCFNCKNNIIKFTNKNNYNEDDMKIIFDTVIDLYKHFRHENKEKFNSQLKFLKKLLKEKSTEIESEM